MLSHIFGCKHLALTPIWKAHLQAPKSTTIKWWSIINGVLVSTYPWVSMSNCLHSVCIYSNMFWFSFTYMKWLGFTPHPVAVTFSRITTCLNPGTPGGSDFHISPAAPQLLILGFGGCHQGLLLQSSWLPPRLHPGNSPKTPPFLISKQRWKMCDAKVPKRWLS